ncbi:MAG: YkgJ family cysteine cluster protein [Gemmatimonadota bacterium]
MNDFMDGYRARAKESGAGCGPNCPGNRIPLTPYEAARMADSLGISTGEFIRRYLDERSAVLTVKDDGSCVFHREGADCEVFEDRPLACRSFLEPADHPARFLERARQYRDVLRAWRRTSLARESAAAEAEAPEGPAEPGVLGVRPSGKPHAAPALGAWVLDVDAVVAERCAEKGVPVPADVEARIDIHLETLRSALE